MGELRFGEIAVWENWGVGELRCGGVAVWGSCDAGELWCEGVMVPNSGLLSYSTEHT